ncbi:MAG: type II secretion system major pseudopilin GspG [Kiritimatiellae bacterium]|nr:type II secretion system major pseudopilin GspG [Kiritimatiellia bacterium]MBQ9345482.1 type II secretion system major pseudopilin GspG [Kiritimatiellia bacterium]
MTTRIPHSSPAFTLVEMLVVLAIISLLAGVVVLNVAPHLLAGSQGKAKAQIQVFTTALQTYRMEQGRYPTREQGLEALVQKPTIPPIPPRYPDAGYLGSRTLPLDPWDAPYIYLIPGRQGEAFEVLTYGADGEEGGTGADQDISSAHMQ